MHNEYQSFVACWKLYFLSNYLNLLCHVEDNKSTVASFEIGADNGSILFLACCIPNIELGNFIVEGDSFHFEIDSGYLLSFCLIVLTIHISDKDGGFANIAIAN